MGMTWKFTMPLLSTLAALVIIVHSAEEEAERNSRYEIRPRVLDTRPASYEQAWRVAEPVIQHSVTADSWNDDAPDTPPVRRRPGRKRKRRPPADTSEEITPQRRYANIDDETPDNNYETTPEYSEELPRRRRRKLKYRLDRYTDNPNADDAPLRRRMHRRRKRPSHDDWPTMSEFGGLQNDDDDTRYSSPKQDNDRGEAKEIDDGEPNKHPIDDEYVESKEIILHNARSKSNFARDEEMYEDKKTTPLGDSKSLSEFSIEVMSGKINEDLQENSVPKSLEKAPKTSNDMDSNQVMILELDKYFDFKSDYIQTDSNNEDVREMHKSIIDIIQEAKASDKYKGYREQKLTEETKKTCIEWLKKIVELSEQYRTCLRTHEHRRMYTDERIKREHATINPQTLKELLKKSNGTSLSELLQQHNLTLADLLSGKENAISVLRSYELSQRTDSKNDTTSEEIKLKKEIRNVVMKSKPENINRRKVPVRSKVIKTHDDSLDNSESNNNKNDSDNIMVNNDTAVNEINQTIVKEEKYLDQNSEKYSIVNTNSSRSQSYTIRANSKNIDSTPGNPVNRRFSGAVRRKLRMRPTLTNNYKSQLNRDLIALSARRYIHPNRRNTTKAKQWREMIPLMPKINTTGELTDADDDEVLTTITVPEETTTAINIDDLLPVTNIDTTVFDNDVQDTTVTEGKEEVETTTLVLEILESEMPSNFTERPRVTPLFRNVNASGLRRQAYNNRLKKKRLQHKTSTTEPPPNDVMKNFLSMGDFVSSSEFIARTQLPKFTNAVENRETVTELEDFMTTETTSQADGVTTTKSKKLHTQTPRISTKSSTAYDYPLITTTEETAKIEIEEIFKDTHISTKLSKILKERNMSLIELLEHRERGSSHVHLADIFHNTSREPNPPEPFLSKSLLEPISKETYPLRALLDANSHDTTTRTTPIDPNIPLTNQIKIPVTMAFGNNVNENAENMGIMSLFNNFTKDSEPAEKTTIQKDSEGTLYKSTIIQVNATDDDSDTRESRMMNDDDQDMVSWNEIFAMIRNHHKNESAEPVKSNEEAPTLTNQRKVTVEKDADGDGLIVLEDLEHVNEPEANGASSSLEKVEYNSYESGEVPHEQNILNSLPTNAKSVTVTTASLVGLAMILFLLTYSALKWKQHRALTRKNNLSDERIPTPVFENRKVKKNCSSRSISPMLTTSNIYTMNTLESQNGKESPEYMWDTLRKPFQ